MRQPKRRVLVVLVTFLALVSSSCGYNDDSVTVTAGLGKVYVTFNEIPTFQMWGLRLIEASRAGHNPTSKTATMILVKRILENMPVQGNGVSARFLRTHLTKIMLDDIAGFHFALNAYDAKKAPYKPRNQRACLRAVLTPSLNVYRVEGWTLIPSGHADCRMGTSLQPGQPTDLFGN